MPGKERPFRIYPNYRTTPDEFMVSVEDKALRENPEMFDIGEDYYCVYGPTAYDAVVAALATIADGTALRHFAGVRQEYGLC